MTAETEVTKVDGSNVQNFGYTDSLDEINTLIQATVPLIWVVTHEEERFLTELEHQVLEPQKKEMWVWSGTQGLFKHVKGSHLWQEKPNSTHEKSTQKNLLNTLKAINDIQLSPNTVGGCFILRDMQDALGPIESRYIRDTWSSLLGSGKTLIVVSSKIAHGPGGQKAGLPPNLEKLCKVVEYELPSHEKIMEEINSLTEYLKNIKKKSSKVRTDYSDEEIKELARAAQGLTLTEYNDAVAVSLKRFNELKVECILQNKKQLLKKSDILEYIDSPAREGDVGGLDLAKEYLKRYSSVHNEEALAFGVEPLKGILLVGVPGTGKSLLAKVIGNMWKQPLLKLDIGKVMGSLVGQSEGKMREVINQAEAMSPCVLWIDEVEKGLAGTKSSNFSDGGTLSRVFGTLLHAMQDRMEGVTIVATANDISLLPPEFIRRFNEVFFVDLPGPAERWDIIDIHLTKRNRTIDSFKKSKKRLLQACEDFTGAEIEKAIKDAVATAYYRDQGKKDLTAKDIIEAMQDTKPIATVMSKKIQEIRKVAKNNYRYASSYAAENNQGRKVKTKQGKSINLDKSLDDLPGLPSKQKTQQTKKEPLSRFVD